MNKLVEILIFVCVFILFAVMSAALLFFITGAVRCITHFIDHTQANPMEAMGLAVVLLIGGTAGLGWFINNIE